MTRNERVKAFASLGNYLTTLSPSEFQSIAAAARAQNPWFTEENVRLAWDGVINFLQHEKLLNWLNEYADINLPKKVALVLAGNIPMVGFHDTLCVLLSGHSALIKSSSKDTYLVKIVLDKLIEIEPQFSSAILFMDQLKGFDAVIATGSDNSARYFDYYFGKYPNIIRKNRSSVAIIDGTETRDDLKALGEDVFSYFGLGCRNVSKLFVPASYTFDTLFESWAPFQNVIHHHKYCNNYDYQKSILLVNKSPFLDNGFVMLQESKKLVSPISVVYYSYYANADDLNDQIQQSLEKIQCIVGKRKPATIAFGKSQCPEPWDYADQIDTLRFLSTL
ncbi:MAG TPA: acyl-CoA reductase [Ohtaekwangia sp.]